MRVCVWAYTSPETSVLISLERVRPAAHACLVRNHNAHSSHTTRAPVLLAPVVPLKIRNQGQWFIKLRLSRKCHAKGTLLCTDANSALSHAAVEKLCTCCFARLQAVRLQSSPRPSQLFPACQQSSARHGECPRRLSLLSHMQFHLRCELVLGCFHVNLTLFFKAVWHVEEASLSALLTCGSALKTFFFYFIRLNLFALFKNPSSGFLNVFKSLMLIHCIFFSPFIFIYLFVFSI